MTPFELFQTDLAQRGVTTILTTEPGFYELTNLGFTLADCISIELDMQAGFSRDEAINALALNTGV